MEKIVFLATLAGKLSEYPMDAEAIEISVAQVKGYIDRVSDEEFAADPATEEDIAAIAKDIYEKHVAAKEAEAKAAEEAALQAEAAQAAAEAVKAAEEAETEATEAAQVQEEAQEETEPTESAPADIEQAEAETDSAEDDLTEYVEYEMADGVFLSDIEPEAEPDSEPEIEKIFAPETETEPEAQIEAAPVSEATEELFAEAVVEQILNEEEPPAPEEIIEQLVSPEEYEEPAPAQPTDEEFFEMLAKEAEGERNDKARIEELELKALAMANKDDPEMVAQVLSQDEKLVEMVAASDIADEFDPIEGSFDPEQRPDMALDEEEEFEDVYVLEDDEFASELMIDKDELNRVDDEKPKKGKKEKKVKVKKEREKVKGTPLFWTLFILTLPITLPLFLCVCVFFGLLYTAVSLLIAVFSVAMVATVACGTAVSLIGIIYGAVQCFGNVPVGLFEIGVGVAAGGVTMLLAVLFYNVAIRFIPRLYKPLNRFGAWAFDGIGQLYTKIKKECGKKK